MDTSKDKMDTSKDEIDKKDTSNHKIDKKDTSKQKMVRLKYTSGKKDTPEKDKL
jgi:hypothetical protein